MKCHHSSTVNVRRKELCVPHTQLHRRLEQAGDDDDDDDDEYDDEEAIRCCAGRYQGKPMPTTITFPCWCG